MTDENLPEQIEAEQAQLDADVAALAADVQPDPFEQAVKAHDDAMAVLASQGLLTDSHLTNLSLRS